MSDVRIITTRDTKDNGKVGTVEREYANGQLLRVKFPDGHSASFWRFETKPVGSNLNIVSQDD